MLILLFFFFIGWSGCGVPKPVAGRPYINDVFKQCERPFLGAWTIIG
jgi:hypothetical protein